MQSEKYKGKFVCFYMRNKELNFTLPMWQAEKVLDSQQQLITIEENGEWTGITVNKADVMMTMPDREAEKDWKIENSVKITAPPEEKSSDKDVKNAKEKIREQMTSF